jgi:hypothetical protein
LKGSAKITGDWSWGWFEDDEWGTALRYRGSFTPFGGGTGLSKDDTFQVGGGIAYENIRDERLQNGGGGLAGFNRDFDEWAGSASIKHVPTGLFVFGAFSINDTHDSNAIGAFNGQRPPVSLSLPSMPVTSAHSPARAGGNHRDQQA